MEVYDKGYQPEWNIADPYIERACEHKIKEYMQGKQYVGCYLSGFSGCGKTTIAKKVVTDLKDNYHDFFYIQISKEIQDSLEGFILFIIQKIQQVTNYNFPNFREKPIFAFNNYIRNTKVCFILDDFEGDVCSKFLDFVVQEKTEAFFIFESSVKRKTHISQKPSHQVMQLIPEIIIEEFLDSEAEKFIERYFSGNKQFELDSINQIKRKLIDKRVFNPYVLLLTLTYITRNGINVIDALDEMLAFFDNYEIDIINELRIDRFLKVLSENDKILLQFITYYGTSFNRKFLTDYNSIIPDCDWLNRESFENLLSNNIIKLLNEDFFCTNSLVKQALNYWLSHPDKDEYRRYYLQARLFWVNFCCAIVAYVGNCYGDVNRLRILDKAGGLEFVKSVVRWCKSPDIIEDESKKRELLDKAIKICSDSSYYCYVRGDGANLNDSIEMLRFSMAKDLNNEKQMFDALVTQLNVSSKRNHTEDSRKLFYSITNMNYKPTEEEDFNEYVKMNHSFALFHNSIGEYNRAYSIWNELFEKKDKLIPKDVCTVSRWMSDCMVNTSDPKFSYEQILKVLEYSKQYSEEKKYKRDYLQSYLKIVNLNLNYGKDVNETEFNDMLIQAKDVGDESYIATYYLIHYKMLKLKAKADNSKLNEARNALSEAKKHYKKIFDETMCERIDNILKNPNLEDEKGNGKQEGLLPTQLY